MTVKPKTWIDEEVLERHFYKWFNKAYRGSEHWDEEKRIFTVKSLFRPFVAGLKVGLQAAADAFNAHGAERVEELAKVVIVEDV